MSAASESGSHVCPWWLAYTFDNPLRRLVHPPERILAGYVAPGMTVLHIGCGFGHFSIGMARLVSDSGCVIALDVQPQMIVKTVGRARRKGVAHIIRPHLSDGRDLGVQDRIDFVLASNVLHEVDNLPALIDQVAHRLKPAGFFYIMEPAGHVRDNRFEKEVDMCISRGLVLSARPRVLRERCAVLQKPEDPTEI